MMEQQRALTRPPFESAERCLREGRADRGQAAPKRGQEGLEGAQLLEQVVGEEVALAARRHRCRAAPLAPSWKAHH